MSLIRKANRSEAFLKLGITGPSGSGKTYSSLLLAKGIMGSLDKVVVIDTENGSANLYSDLGDYSVLPLEAPFGPHRYSGAINYVIKEGFKFIIIDSVSHEWDGKGGCLEIHQNMGGKFQDWSKVTPMHKGFVDSILQCKAHVLCTMRRKQDYGMVEKNGRMVVEKMGLKEIQRDGFEYDLSINFDINMEHMCTASKDRTGLFSDNVPFKITEDTGKRIRAWNEIGTKIENKKEIKNYANEINL